MRAALRLFVLVAVAVVATTVSTSPRAQNQAPHGDPGSGKRLYLADGCFECHGRVGQGGAFLGPAPMLARTQLPYEAFAQQVREPSNNMPAYVEGVLPDHDLADIYAYVQSLPGPGDAKDLPALLRN
ncbi:MAG TPA: cytochrome c [Stellaceae bacterium]|nr:cytochrome c [Stellaceae bacterium]